MSERPRTYDRKVRNAQEAHEAIRPAGDRFVLPQALTSLSRDEQRLYELVWQRTLASQMIDATGTTARVRIDAHTSVASALGDAGLGVQFGVSGTVITSPGFLRVYQESDDTEEEDRTDEQRLPDLHQGARCASPA